MPLSFKRHPLELLFIYTSIIDFAIRRTIFPCQFDFLWFFPGLFGSQDVPAGVFYTVQVKRGLLIKAYYSLSSLHELELVTWEPFILLTHGVTTQATKLIRINTHNHSLSTSSLFKPYFAPTCLSKAATLNALHEFLSVHCRLYQERLTYIFVEEHFCQSRQAIGNLWSLIFLPGNQSSLLHQAKWNAFLRKSI